jgi:hypothetical protein
VNGSGKSSLSNLLYLWQIFLKQTENMKNSPHPEQVLIAALVILSHTASFPNIEGLMIKNNCENFSLETNNIKKSEVTGKVEKIIGVPINPIKEEANKLLGDILNKFPSATVTEIE